MPTPTPSRRDLLAWGVAGLASALLPARRGEAVDDAVLLGAGFAEPERGTILPASSVAADPSLVSAGVQVTLRGAVDPGASLRFLDVRAVLPSSPPVEFHAWSHDARNPDNVRTGGSVGFFAPLRLNGSLVLRGEAHYRLPGRLGSVPGQDGRPLLVKRPWELSLSAAGGRGGRLREGTYLLAIPASATTAAPSWKGFRPGAPGTEPAAVVRPRADGGAEAPPFPYLVLDVTRAGPGSPT